MVCAAHVLCYPRDGRRGVSIEEVSRCYLLCPLWASPDFIGDFPDVSFFVLFLFLDFLGGPTRKFPERVKDTIRNFPPPPKMGTPPAYLLPSSS